MCFRLSLASLPRKNSPFPQKKAKSLHNMYCSSRPQLYFHWIEVRVNGGKKQNTINWLGKEVFFHLGFFRILYRSNNSNHNLLKHY
jgi:hypothetical protein